MKRLLILPILFVAGACASKVKHASQRDLEIFDEVQNCFKAEVEEKAVESTCSKQFQNTTVTGDIREAQVVGGKLRVELELSDRSFNTRKVICIVDDKSETKVDPTSLRIGQGATVKGKPMAWSQRVTNHAITLEACSIRTAKY